MYWLERACEIQMKVLASNMPWKTLSREVCLRSANQEHEPRDITEDFRPGIREWPTLERLVDRDDPGYRT